MFFDVINSGSKGNATVVFTKKATILIDAGIPGCTIEEELNKFNKSLKDIDVVLVTHNHTDHIRNIKAFSPKKIYSLERTIPGSLSNVLEVNTPIQLFDVTVTAFPTSHDALNPCGFVLESDDEKLVYMTDTGCFLEENLSLIKNPTYLIIESNHDIKMLLNTNRTYQLKQRILSDVGHLCNEDSAIAATQIIGNNTKEIILAHLSEEANTPELALAAYVKIFKHFGLDIDKYNVRCANQHHSLIGGNLNED